MLFVLQFNRNTKKNQGNSCLLYVAKINYTKKHFPIITEEITPEHRNTHTKMMLLILFSLTRFLNSYYTLDKCFLIVFLFAKGSDKIIFVISSITNNNDIKFVYRQAVVVYHSNHQSVIYEDEIRIRTNYIFVSKLLPTSLKHQSLPKM